LRFEGCGVGNDNQDADCRLYPPRGSADGGVEMNTTTTKSAKSTEFADLSLQRRGQLEQEFIDRHKHATEASNVIRLDRIYAGQALIELKEGLAHGDWLPYLATLCVRADISEKTATTYMKDAAIASKIPQPILAEAEQQGFNIKARHIRRNLIDWLLAHPTDAREPKYIIKDALGIFVSPEDRAQRDAAEKAAWEVYKARCEEFEKFRETHPDPSDEGYAKYKEFASDFPDPEADAYAARQQAQRAKWSRDEGRRQQQEAFALKIIDAGYKKLANEYHPDHGGKKEDFQLLKEAADLLKASLKEINEGLARRAARQPK
jgi:hypothetical protein